MQPDIETVPTPYPFGPVRGWLNARFFHAFDGAIDRMMGERRRSLLRDLPDEIVEIGPGVGGNLRCYPPGSRLVAVEPNPAMHHLLRRNARQAGIDLDLHPVGVEELDLPDESAAVVVSNLVLCTVPDQHAALAEIRRVLRPGGRFLFIEHVAAGGRAMRALQRTVRRPWRYVFEGCCVDRSTEATIGEYFERLEVERYTARSPFVPVNPQISGVAYKAAASPTEGPHRSAVPVSAAVGFDAAG